MRNLKIISLLICTLAFVLASALGQTNYATSTYQGSGYWDSGLVGTTAIWTNCVNSAVGTLTATAAEAADPLATFEVLPGAKLRVTAPPRMGRPPPGVLCFPRD